MMVRVVRHAKRLDRQLVAAVVHSRRKAADANRVLALVSDRTGFSLAEMASDRRSRLVTYARHLAMWALHEHARLGPTEIGFALGGRDHSTVLAGIKRIALEATWHEDVRGDIEAIARAIQVAA